MNNSKETLLGDSTMDNTNSTQGQGIPIPPLPPNVSIKSSNSGLSAERITRSIVWDHFKRIPNCDLSKLMAICNYCRADYACEMKTKDTKYMKYHIEHQYKKCLFNKADDESQTTLG